MNGGDPAATPTTSPGLGAIAWWLLPQLVLLGLIAGGARLWSQQQAHLGSIAVSAMFMTQTTWAALFAPRLLRDWRTALGMIAGAAPMLLLACAVEGAEPRAALQAWLRLGVFVLITGLLLGRTRSHPLAGTVVWLSAVLLCLGVPLARFVLLEQSGTCPGWLDWLSRTTP